MSGWAIWITGLPGSGKSTIASILKRKLLREGTHVQIVSVEMLRKVLTPKPSWSEEERDMVYGALVYFASLLTRNNVNVIIDATANRKRYRDAARRSIRRFAEVYLKCPLEVCIEREIRRKKRFGAPAKIYYKAKTGASRTVPGVGVPFEEPPNPELVLETSKLRASACADKIVDFLRQEFDLEQ